MRKIFVADFGAGNTCMYTINPDSEVHEPSDLIEPLGEPSGYALKRDGTTILGMGLYGLGCNEDISQFHINLKAQPTEQNEDEMVFYFSEWLNKLKRERPMEFKGVDQAYWLIGCPTGEAWKAKQTRERYKQMFERAGFENVSIIPESNAAMAYYQKTNGMLENLPQDGQMLLLDQGAYSLDATYYYGGEIHSFGSYLGASLIDRMIVHMVLYEEEETFRRKKTMINLREVRDPARERLEREGIGSYFHTYLLLQARLLKERYFTALRQGTLRVDNDMQHETDFKEDGDEFTLFVNSGMMHAILEERSVRSVLGDEFDTLAREVQQELGDLSWMEAFRRYLDAVKRKFEALGDGKKVAIMLTGGGSQMNCIGETVKRFFPAADIHQDFNAVSAIGKGMAVWGPDKIKSMDFQEAFKAFMERETTDEDGDKVTLVAGKLSKAFLECAVNISRSLVAEEVEAVQSGIQQWLSYNCNSMAIPDKIESHLKDWIQKQGLPQFEKDINEHIDILKNELNEELYGVMDACRVKREPLLKAEDKVFLSECVRIMPKIFGVIVDEIVTHYKENEIWTKFFINEGRGIISNPRKNFYNAYKKKLDDWLDNETDATIDLCNRAFYVIEYDFGTDDRYTLSQLFVLEGYIDLFTLMEGRVKSILGKLVLEEYIEDD